MSYDDEEIRQEAVDLLSAMHTWRLTSEGWSEVERHLDALSAAAGRNDPIGVKRATDRLEDTVATRRRPPRSLSDNRTGPRPAPPPVLERKGVVVHELGGRDDPAPDRPDER
ncbi:CATRA system-associated protein [Streptomyces sp. JHA26]|uniref:CATRA system-associated protein n=1 Tax=Streptomyces sp. JHA26 TaxID=1917143 RepID=UPI00098BC7BA|nr:CATRA system-associated protein [Streptomyces sp. JHA26]